MNKGVLLLAIFLAGGGEVLSQSSATQLLTLEVKPITKISVSGDPGSLHVTDFTPGLTTASVSDNSTSYNITTNLNSVKIAASINNPMPVGTRLMVRLESSKGSSVGLVDISGALSPVDVVQGIGRGTEAGQPISYVFAADADVGEIPPQARTITLTLSE